MSTATPVYTIFQNVTDQGGIPEYVFAMYQCMFAMITVALISGAVVERVKFCRLVPLRHPLDDPGL